MGVAHGEMAVDNLDSAGWETEETNMIASIMPAPAFQVGMLVMTMYLSVAPMLSPYHHHPPGLAMEVFTTCFFFAFVTAHVQVIVAVGAPAPRLLAPWLAWVFGVGMSSFAAVYFLSYADVSARALRPSCNWDLVAAGVASFLNLAITVYIILRRPVRG